MEHLLTWLKAIAVGAVALLMVAFLVGGFFINGLFMLVSPRAWFRLPRWIRTQGSFTEAKCESGWGAIQVRVLGGVFLLAAVGLLYFVLRHLVLHFLFRH